MLLFNIDSFTRENNAILQLVIGSLAVSLVTFNKDRINIYCQYPFWFPAFM